VFFFTHPNGRTFPFKALEAMGCGLPVIAATSDSAGELLRHGENCLTYRPATRSIWPRASGVADLPCPALPDG